MNWIHPMRLLPAVGILLVASGCTRSAESDGDVGADASSKSGTVGYALKASEIPADSLTEFDLVIHLRSPDAKGHMLALKGHIKQIDIQTDMNYTAPIGDTSSFPQIKGDSGSSNDTSAKFRLVTTPVKKPN